MTFPLVWTVSFFAPSTLAWMTLVVAAALAIGRRRVRKTTLTAAWGWAAGSLTALFMVELAVTINGEPADWVNPARYLAAATTFGPLMALLGSKRPQHRAWQFIVLTLLVVLSLPAATVLVLGHRELSVHWARGVFFVLLAVLGLINGLGTRYWPASGLLALGQMLLLANYLPWFAEEVDNLAYLLGVTAIVGSAVLAAILPSRSRDPQGWNRVWIDYRNLYGSIWGLRVMERTNATLTQAKLPLLHWAGFESEPSNEQIEALRPLLRRFVSAEWIDRRLDGD